MVVLDCKAIDVADLLSGKDGLHGTQINTDLKCRFARIRGKQKAPAKPAPPARRCTVFPGYLIDIFNTVHSPKNFWNKYWACSRKKEHLTSGYIVIAARTLP